MGSVSKKRDLMDISHRLIPMMNDDEMYKVGIVFIEIMQRLEKEGRVSKD